MACMSGWDVRETRWAQRKKLRAMELAKKAGPDEMKKAERELKKIDKRAVQEGKKFIEGCRRG